METTTSSSTKDLTTTKKLNIPSNTENTSTFSSSDSSSFSSSPEMEHYKPKKTKIRHSSLDLESSPRHLSATAKLRHSISLTTTYNNNSEYTDDIYDFINEICEKERRSKVSVLREIIGKQLSAGSESELLPDILEDIDNRDCYGYIECKNIK